MNNIFTIKAVEFEHQKEDPFGFDASADRIAEKYIKISGVIRKPIYLVFVSYVNELLRTNQINLADKKVGDIKNRLEKLLVLSWKRDRNVKGQSVIGNRIININPFDARDGNWVVQNCFKIYEASARKLNLNKIVSYYISKNKHEIKLLNEFLGRGGHLSNNQKYLSNLLIKMSKKRASIFSGKTILTKQLRRMFIKSLRDSANQGLFNHDQLFIKKIFNKPAKSGNEIEKILKAEKYPFRSFNTWVRNFVLAVDADINGRESTFAWNKTNKAFIELKIPSKPEMRPKERCWFRFDGKKYLIAVDFDSAGWDAVLRRAKRPDGNFFDFKLTALHSLLKEAAEDE